VFSLRIIRKGYDFISCVRCSWGAISDNYTVKKAFRYSRSQSGCYLTNSPLESLVSDIPAGDGNIEKLFYGVVQHFEAFLPGLNFFFQQKNLEQSWQHCLRDLQREWKTEDEK
jgi:hypothetical protein